MDIRLHLSVVIYVEIQPKPGDQGEKTQRKQRTGFYWVFSDAINSIKYKYKKLFKEVVGTSTDSGLETANFDGGTIRRTNVWNRDLAEKFHLRWILEFHSFIMFLIMFLHLKILMFPVTLYKNRVGRSEMFLLKKISLQY